MSNQVYSGRLVLTRANKHLHQLGHEEGGYQCVSPANYRVAEVRLLDNAGTVRDVHPH